MAAKERAYKFNYENGQFFRLFQNLDEAGWTTIIDMTENGDIADLFAKGVTDSLKHFFADVVDGIVKEMETA